jgi:subtilase family serine protease
MKPELKTITPRDRLANVLAIFALPLLALTGTAQGAQRQTLHGHVPAAVYRTQPIGRLPGSNRLDLAIGLPLRNREGLTNLLQALSNPASTNFHKYLTPEQFAERFGPPEADYQALKEFARANKLRITGTHPNRTLLDVSASVAEVEKAFGVTMRVYKHPVEARTFYAPDAEPSLGLDLPVLALGGLDNYLLPRPKKNKGIGKRPTIETPKIGSGPSGSYTASDLRAAYVPGVALTGAGQSVGLFEFDGYYANDIRAYEMSNSLPNVTLQNVPIDGFDFNAAPGENNDEVAVDIEMAIAMAPGLSSVIVYSSPNGSPGHSNNLLNRMATDNLARQLSCSWGLGINATTEQIFQQFAAQGQSFFNASGDDGAVVGAITTGEDDPYITIVGGTVLSMTGSGRAWQSETAWAGSGGGSSTTQAIPSWQQGVDMSASQGSTSKRNFPDVAIISAGFFDIVNNGHVEPDGTGANAGTSYSAPLWAALIALVNEQAAASGRPPVGFINPIIYALGRGEGYNSYFHDVATGNDTNTASPTRFFAVLGYDLCTGWGSPKGASLINALASYSGAVWVQFGISGPGEGTYDHPYYSLGLATNAVSPWGTIAIKGPGSSAETMTVAKPMTLQAAGGRVTVGQ